MRTSRRKDRAWRVSMTDSVDSEVGPYIARLSESSSSPLGSVERCQGDECDASIRFFTGREDILCSGRLTDHHEHCTKFSYTDMRATPPTVWLNKKSWDCNKPRYRDYIVEHELRHALLDERHADSGVMRQQSHELGC